MKCFFLLGIHFTRTGFNTPNHVLYSLNTVELIYKKIIFTRSEYVSWMILIWLDKWYYFFSWLGLLNKLPKLLRVSRQRTSVKENTSQKTHAFSVLSFCWNRYHTTGNHHWVYTILNILKSWRCFWQEWVTVTFTWHCHLLIHGACKMSTEGLGTMNNWLVRKRKLKMEDEFLFVEIRRWLWLMLKDLKDFKFR